MDESKAEPRPKNYGCPVIEGVWCCAYGMSDNFLVLGNRSVQLDGGVLR